MVRVILFVANASVVLLLLAAAYFFNWSGPGFALGFGLGFLACFVYIRLKLGHWV